MPADLFEAMKAEKNAAEEFSFNQGQLRGHITADEGGIKIIRAQLYAEHVLERMLDEALPRKGILDQEAVSFGTKLKLVVALGHLSENMRPAIVKLNALRNKVAHELDFVPGNDEKRTFWFSLPVHLREAVLKDFPEPEDEWVKVPLSRMFEVAILWMDIARQQAEVGRIQMKYSSLYLKRTLDKANAHG